MKRLAKAVYIRLRGSVIRHTGNAVFRTHCPREDQAALPPLGEFRAEMVGDVQMQPVGPSKTKEMQIAGPNGFERSYTLEGTAGEHRPEVIRAIVGRMVLGIC